MNRATYLPTAQTGTATSSGGGTNNTTVQADPVSGNHVSVAISVHVTYTNNGGGSTVRYTLDGVGFTTIRSVGDNGGVPETHTDSVSLGNVDTTNLAVRVTASSGPGTDGTAQLLDWNVTFIVPTGIIAQTE